MTKPIFLNLWLWAVLFAGLLLRLVLASSGFHVDLLSITSWGEWIYQYGPKGFYEHEIWIYSWPTQLPMVNLIYGFNYYLYEQIHSWLVHLGVFIAVFHLFPTKMLWFFDFAGQFGTVAYLDTPLKLWAMGTVKLLAIFADLSIAIIVYMLARKVKPKLALWLTAAYLFSPFSWYLSALWGQYDQLGFLLTLVSFLLLFYRKFILATMLLVVSIELKPTSLIFIPFFGWLYFSLKPRCLDLFFSVAASLVVASLTLLPFTDQNFMNFIQEVLFPKVFLKAEFRVSTHSFNFWHILIGDRALNQNFPFLFIPAKIWGGIGFLVINLIACSSIKKKTLENLFVSLFIIAGGSWLFMVNMLERYFFAGVTFLLFFCIYQPRFFKYWIVLSLAFWLNLYEGWWFPDGLAIIRQALVWEEGVVTRVLSLINVIIFLLVVRSLDLGKIKLLSFKSVLSLLTSLKLVR